MKARFVLPASGVLADDQRATAVAVQGGTITEDGVEVGRIDRVLAITAVGVEVEATITDAATAKRMRRG